MKTLKPIILTMILILGITSLSTAQSARQWEVPAKYKAMKNAVKVDDASTKAGKDLFAKNCSSCHGKAGLGDGPKARGLDNSPGNFSGTAFQSQTDGDLFFKTKFGRDEMPKYEGKIDDESIWQIVNFMRTLKK